MPLPLARNETATNGTAPRAATINDLQDATIGAWHGAIPIVLDVFAFTKSSGAAVLTTFDHWLGIGSFEAQLRLPAGTSVVGMKWHYDRGGSDVNLRLRRRRFTDGVGYVDTSVLIADAASPSAFTTKVVTAADVAAVALVGAGDAYSIEVVHTGAGNKLYAVEYTITKGP